MTAGKSGGEPNALIFAEASEWLVDFREGEVDAEGSQRFNAWLRRSPENIQAYMEAAAMWGDIPRLAAGMEVDVDAVIARVRMHGNVKTLHVMDISAPIATSVPMDIGAKKARTDDAKNSKGDIPRFLKAWAVAAAVATVMVATALVVFQGLNRGSMYTTAIGEQRSFMLADGSTVLLGPRSQVQVQMSNQRRQLALLAGQALFKVTKDPSRPFVVASDHTWVRAVGTQFDVHKRNSGTTITVLEGSVAVLPDPALSNGAVDGADLSSPKKARAASAVDHGLMWRTDNNQKSQHALYVSAGQQVTVPVNDNLGPRRVGDKPIPRAQPIDSTSAEAWADKTLMFADAPLSDVIEEFNRYNERQLVLTDRGLESLRVSGVFSAIKPSSLLRFLDEQMRLQITETSRQIEISPRPQNKPASR